MATTIDLNADMGESFGRWVLGDDASLMPQLTSANIACGFHGGDPHQMRKTVRLAIGHGVGVGAHVGLPDLIGFGRRRLAVSAEELHDYVLYQAGAMKGFAEAAGGRLQHVKPHGILYTMIKEDADLAAAAVEATAALGDGAIFLLAGTNAEQACARAGIRFVPEAYVDLDYDGEGALVLERVKQVRDPQATAERAAKLATTQRVTTTAGTEIEVTTKSICIHGDAPNAVEIATAVRRALEAASVELRPLAELD
jgi:UPF0271 protein